MNKLKIDLKYYLYLSFLVLNFGCQNNDIIEEPKPADLASVTVSEIKAKAVILSSLIIDDGNSNIIEKGFVWSVEKEPTINNNKILISDNHSESFAIQITGLEPNTQYFVKAFAKNEHGISYSEETEFQTSHYIYEGSVRLKTQSEVNDFGVKGYTSISGTLFIGDMLTNSDISSLDKLHQLTEIGGGLNIQGFNKITDLSGLENLISIGAIFIQDSDLNNLDELINITTLDGGESGGLISFLGNNNKLTSLDGLKNIKAIASYFHLFSNPQLTNLDGLSGLNSVRKLIIEYHPKITNLDGLINIKSIGSACEINGNTTLNNFCAFTTILSSDSNFSFMATGNAYNPSKQDLLDGKCSQ